jgi:uncharacterized membrane protein
MTDTLLVMVLRLFHIVGGLFWAGAVLVSAAFLLPAMGDVPEGGRFMQRVMVDRRMSAWLTAAAVSTMLTGLWMYGRFAVYGGGAWMQSRGGMMLTLGGLLGVTAGITGGAVVGPTGKRLGEVGARLQAAGGPPAAADLAEARRLQARLTTTTRVVAVLLLGTAAAMAVARYV